MRSGAISPEINFSISSACLETLLTVPTEIVAVMTDVIRNGETVCGFAFNSTGCYACGAQMRDRLMPRIMRTEPERLVNTEHGNFDPDAVLRAMMFGEKPGGDMERSVGIGTIEVAL